MLTLIVADDVHHEQNSYHFNELRINPVLFKYCFSQSSIRERKMYEFGNVTLHLSNFKNSEFDTNLVSFFKLHHGC